MTGWKLIRLLLALLIPGGTLLLLAWLAARMFLTRRAAQPVSKMPAPRAAMTSRRATSPTDTSPALASIRSRAPWQQPTAGRRVSEALR
jgi:hypothetical protein